jgi:translocator protein
MPRRDILVLTGLILLCEGAGGFGALFTRDAIPGWYATLVRPWFAPPNWLFGPVWTTLYALMAVAAWLVWRQYAAQPAAVRRALLLFAGQLLLNALWTPVFFGLGNIGGALIVIFLLLAAIAATMVAFYRLTPAACWLLAPYFIWVAFASLLNAEFWKLN